jgi:hypothetical protein
MLWTAPTLRHRCAKLKRRLVPARFAGTKLRRNIIRVLAAEPAQALAIKLTQLETWIAAVDRTYECTGLQTPWIVLSARDADGAAEYCECNDEAFHASLSNQTGPCLKAILKIVRAARMASACHSSRQAEKITPHCCCRRFSSRSDNRSHSRRRSLHKPEYRRTDCSRSPYSSRSAKTNMGLPRSHSR